MMRIVMLFALCMVFAGPMEALPPQLPAIYPPETAPLHNEGLKTSAIKSVDHLAQNQLPTPAYSIFETIFYPLFHPEQGIKQLSAHLRGAQLPHPILKDGAHLLANGLDHQWVALGLMGGGLFGLLRAGRLLMRIF